MEVDATDTTYTVVQVGHALNRAADDILEATEAEDEGLRDAINLMVNASICYLTGDATTLDAVAAHGYDADLDEILGWIAQGVR